MSRNPVERTSDWSQENWRLQSQNQTRADEQTRPGLRGGTNSGMSTHRSNPQPATRPLHRARWVSRENRGARRVMVNGAGKVVRETSGRRDVAGYVWHRSTRLPHWQILIGTRYVTSQNEHILRHTLEYMHTCATCARYSL